MGESLSPEQQCALNQLIAGYLHAAELGMPVNRNELLARHPDLAEHLRSFFTAQDVGSAPRTTDSEACNAVRRADPTDAAGSADTVAFKEHDTAASPASSAPAAPHGRYFGDYELLEEIARGGMGVVYKALQISLHRIVALKMILAGQLASAEDVRRLHAEAEAAAGLDHPGIVPVFDVGQCDGQHYFAMGYVEGSSLAERLAHGPLPATEAAALMVQIAQAVAYAHRQGVIHRDLKPSNILLSVVSGPSSVAEDRNRESTDHGLRTTDCLARITDFGLAKRVTGDSQLTATGQVLGTPSYMPPEQAAGQLHRVGTTSDIYALGAVLYAMLTGRPPFHGESPVDTLAHVLDADPAQPRLLNPQVPHDLETITLKCLQKDPAERYQSAEELAAELQRFLEGEPIHASSINLLKRVTRALSQSHNEEYLQGWGLALICFGLVIAGAHLIMYLLTRADYGILLGQIVPRGVMFLFIGLVLWRGRGQSMYPHNSVERMIWVVWISYLLGYVALEVVLVMQGRPALEIYPAAAILSGMCFFIMGCHVWGPSYALGLAFLLAAPFLAWEPVSSILTFGLLWGAALSIIGVHFARRGKREAG